MSFGCLHTLWCPHAYKVHIFRVCQTHCDVGMHAKSMYVMCVTHIVVSASINSLRSVDPTALPYPLAPLQICGKTVLQRIRRRHFTSSRFHVSHDSSQSRQLPSVRNKTVHQKRMCVQRSCPQLIDAQEDCAHKAKRMQHERRKAHP